MEHATDRGHVFDPTTGELVHYTVLHDGQVSATGRLTRPDGGAVLTQHRQTAG